MEDNVEETLNRLNTFSFQPRRKLSLDSMIPNKKYRIFAAETTLKLNKSRKSVVRLDVDDVFIYLPERFKKIPATIWNELSSGRFEICKVGRYYKTYHLTFSNVESAVNDTSHQFNLIEYLNNFAYTSNSEQKVDNNESS